MAFSNLHIRNLRVFHDLRLNFDNSTNLIIGDNACGKTTILEALSILSTGRSFRTKDMQSICRHECNGFEISSLLIENGPQPEQIAIQYTDGRKQYKLNSLKTALLSDIAQRTPILIISPDSHYQFHSKQSDRRAVMDWILFHVEPGFHETWKRFGRALVQRNRLLRSKGSQKELYPWDQEISEYGELIDNMRSEIVQRIDPIFREVCAQFGSLSSELRLQYYPGWQNGVRLKETLDGDLNQDRASGYTHSGPHRADLDVYIGDSPAKTEASHGQSKIIFYALRVAQSIFLQKSTGKRCSILIDDLPAELDETNQVRMMSIVLELHNQIFVTATRENKLLPNMLDCGSVFHVEQGTLV